ncbi:TldD/PmbA family protein [Bermanella marisrubri]|uniref:Putative TldD protein n=1 Tax=Bermanella marisrubri TaxID=207949 RepID=Q1N3N3_9GAMM|nr:TldD/PmbA family protein [Bermanella marisrubri]EAT12841.1 putative TldD protein [Oceanobacter sp. RED65] [Bermanella marisrubri]QIZ83162.1 TldD/PmbA family protein [Bermanella marisrubri]
MLDSSVAKQVIDAACHKGADFAELFVERHLTANISTLASQVDSVDSGEEFGVGVRLVFGQKVLYGYSNQPELNILLDIVNDLASGQQGSHSANPSSLKIMDVHNRHPVSRILTVDSDFNSKLEFLLAAEQKAKAVSEKIIKVRGSVMQRQQHVEIFNSEGLHVEDERHYTRTSVTAIAKDGSLQATGSFNDGGLIGWELQNRIDAQHFGEEAARQALVNLSAKPCPSGHMPVVMGPGFGGVIFHEACGHLLETTSVAKQASVFHDKMGEMIASSVVSAVDDGTLSNEWGSINIDDEGMPTQKTQLIKDGKLVNFLADRVGAEQTGLPRTGSGRRQNYKFAPASRMRNTFIEAGDSSLDDMLASIDRGIYASHMGGGSVKPGTGEFNFSVLEGYYVENGKIQYPVKAATLIGTGPQVLKDISMVGRDFSLACGMCGSVSGAIPTTVGQPSLKVDNILVGGNA